MRLTWRQNLACVFFVLWIIEVTGMYFGFLRQDWHYLLMIVCFLCGAVFAVWDSHLNFRATQNANSRGFGVVVKPNDEKKM